MHTTYPLLVNLCFSRDKVNFAHDDDDDAQPEAASLQKHFPDHNNMAFQLKLMHCKLMYNEQLHCSRLSVIYVN